MRPPKERQGALKAPFNDILGTEVNVRLARELSLSPDWFGAGDLARRADLDRSAVYRALDRLFNTGILEIEERSSIRRCRLRGEHPLVPGIQALFRSEAQRFEDILEGVAEAVEALAPPPMSAWIEGPVAREEDEFGDPLIVGLLDIPDYLDQHVAWLYEHLVTLQRQFDVTVEIRGRTRADLAHLPDEERARIADARPVFGPPVETFLARDHDHRREAPRDHADLDERALRFGRAVAERLRTHPELVDRAIEWVQERLAEAPAGAFRELEEWLWILKSTTPARLAALLADEGQRATRLRQSNPFLPLLTAEERAELTSRSE